MQKGYYKKSIEAEQSNQKKKNQNKQQELFDMQLVQNKKNSLEEELLKLREQYMDNDFVELVLEQYQ